MTCTRWLAAVAVVCLAATSVAQQNTAPAAGPALDKAAVEAYVRHLHVWGPQIAMRVGDPKPSSIAGLYEVTIQASAGQASLEEKLLVSQDGRKIIRGAVYDLKESPFQNELNKLTTQGDASFGPAEAPVTIAVFSDLQCSFCKEEAKLLRETLPKAFPKEVRVVFKDYPLDPIHPWARTAAIAGRCIAKQNNETFWEYHDWMFENQSQFTAENVKAKIAEWTKGRKVEPVSLASCIENRSTEPEVNASVAQGRALNVDSTPTIFLNGRRLVGQQNWAQLKQIIEHEVAYQKQRTQACCEVKVPSALSR